MSGGIGYVYDCEGTFLSKFNSDSADVEVPSTSDLVHLKSRIKEHVKYTDSELGNQIIRNWETAKTSFVKIFPRDFKRVLEAKESMEAYG